MLTEAQRAFLNDQRVAHLATADASGAPHVVPVCFAVAGTNAYITVDEKPKRRLGNALKRLRNIAENPSVALVADYYDDRDWSLLGWVMLRGRAEILTTGPEHDEAQQRLRERYQQMQEMTLDGHPVIAIRIDRAVDWGKLGPV
jgi:PPOX class probable F420-dependent enzyme